MSRHRHFQAINSKKGYYDDEYDDDYEDEDDGTGSYADAYCVSPGTAAQFTYNRDSKGNQSFADYLSKEEENEIPEETNDELDCSMGDSIGSFDRYALSDEDQGKLLSCMDAIRDVIGDTIPESLVCRAILNCNYDCDRALDRLLNAQSDQPAHSIQQLSASKPPDSSMGTFTAGLLANHRSVHGLLSTPLSGLSPQPTANTSKLSLSNLGALNLGTTTSGASLNSLALDHLQGKTPTLQLGKPSESTLQLNKPSQNTLQLGKPSENTLQLNKPSQNTLQLGKPLKTLQLNKPSQNTLQLGKPENTMQLGKPSHHTLQLNVDQPVPVLLLKVSGEQESFSGSSLGLDLSQALRPKVVGVDTLTASLEESMESTSDNDVSLSDDNELTSPLSIYKFEGEVNEKLVCKEISQLGRLLCSAPCRVCTDGHGDSLWSYHSQRTLVHASLLKSIAEPSTFPVQSFDFMSPSPDDLVLAKQKGAFTRTGERVGSKTPVQKSPTKASTKPAQQPAKPAVFHIGDSFRSDEETDTRLSESTSQLSLKSSNGAISKKEPRTPNSAQLKGIKALIDAEGTRSPSISRSSSKSKLERLDPQVEYKKRSEEGKDLINLVVIGHVDAGKSTLMGHVLCDLGVVSQRQMHRYEMDSKKLGKASFMYAWVLDETEEERSRGVTMDVAQTRFETKNRTINLLDAPGHKDFIPNMITGAAQADCALLVVNATRGEFETGFELGGQTREHTILIRSLGVSQLVVAINKMDTVDWSQTRYLEIASKMSVFLKQAGFKEADIEYIPCSGLNGVNLVKPSTGLPEFSWYTGKALIDVIENFKPPVRAVNMPLRMCVQDIFKGQGGSFSVAGRMEAGDVQNGDRVLVMPSAEQASVKSMLLDDRSERIGFAGDYVTLQLVGIDIQKVHVGSILCDIASPVPVVTKFRARLVIFNIEVPITKGSQVVYHSQSMNEPAHISKLISKLHKNTGEVLKSKPRCLTKNSTAVVEITLARPQCLELYKDYKDLGRFMLRSEGHTIAAGLVTELCPNKS